MTSGCIALNCDNCNGGQCVSLWNGSHCNNDETNAVSLNDTSSITISSLSSLFLLQNVSLQVRTQQLNVLLMTINNDTVLEVIYNLIINN